MILTRRIKFYPSNADDKKKLFDYLYNAQKVLNDVYRNIAIVNYIQNMDYLKDGVRKDVADICTNKSPNYTVAKKYKDVLPASIYDACSTTANTDFRNDLKELNKGRRSLRNYKIGTSPFRARALKFVSKEKHYQFNLFGIPVTFVLGADKNNTADILNKCIHKLDGYKFSDSKFQYCKDDKEFYLLLSVNFKEQEFEFDPNMVANVTIGTEYLLNIEYGAKEIYKIGHVGNFIDKRTQMRAARRRLNQNLKFVIGGKGRNRKMRASDKIGDAESRFVDTYIHQSSAELIKFLIKNKIEIVYLKTDKSIINDVPKDIEKLIVSNWSSYSLESKIMYKAKYNGIKIVREKDLKESNELTEAVCAAEKRGATTR